VSSPRPTLDALPELARLWFSRTFAAPTSIQSEGWRHIASGDHTLIAAPTGSGKTLAAFLWAVGDLAERARRGVLEDRIHIVYVSPLSALGNDISLNLEQPLDGIRRLVVDRNRPCSEIRVAVRSGDTPARDRQHQLRKPPHILITTPESLYILLTAERSREILSRARTVIVDEIHALAGNKRGCHLALSLERLDDLCGRKLQRIGLSATQRPIDEVARFLVGSQTPAADSPPTCRIVDAGHRRELDLRIETTQHELAAIPTHDLRAAIFDRIADLIRVHRTTIVFSDTRRMVERIAHELGERLGHERVGAHHGSLSRETRLRAERRLASGEIPVIVASASLELGIDVGHVDLVCQLGAPRSLSTLLQRVGRSGHCLGETPRGRFFPTTRDELVQCAAAVRAVRAGELDALETPKPPRDILAQQIVAHVASGERPVDDVWRLVRNAYPFRSLERDCFESILDTLADGVSTRRGRRSAYLHRDRVHDVLRPRRGARMNAITNGGAIPDVADYEVIEANSESLVGSINEDFAIESLAGDVFLLGNRSWRIERIEANRVRVSDAHGAPPSIPFWLGEAPARTRELSAAVSDLRRAVAERLDDRDGLVAWLGDECQLDRGGAEQIVEYVATTRRALGTVPDLRTIVAERFFDEAGGMQLVLHSPFGGRINRALGLALRKRFCVSFDFELQAAATDDGVVLSLGEQHSFALDSVFDMLHPDTFEADLVQAILVSPMFTNRWRWNASRSLALPRFSGGRKVPMPIQRMRAEDLMAAVFPAQLACGDNRAGPIEVPAHPLVDETIDNCLHEAMDVDGLRALLEDIAGGEIETVAAETAAPSPMSHEILNANPYAFLDDAPLEERRARAVALRRTDPDLGSAEGALSDAAIDEVRRQAWPLVRDPDEAHDALLSLGAIPRGEAASWADFIEVLIADGRAVLLQPPSEASAIYVATEKLALARSIWPEASYTPPRHIPAGIDQHHSSRSQAEYEVVRGWMEAVGPTTIAELAARTTLSEAAVAAALARLEGDGVVLRGAFTAGAQPQSELCERGLLARIHRRTIGDLRREIEPVAPAELMRFLFRWQHVEAHGRLHGRNGVAEVLRQLEGIEAPAHAWESSILPTRVANYDPSDLDTLCLSGEIAWGRLSPALIENDGSETNKAKRLPNRNARLSFFRRDHADTILYTRSVEMDGNATLGQSERAVVQHLRDCGASFTRDIAEATQLASAEVEIALWELVAAGLVTGDGDAGLRALIDRATRKPRASHLRAVGRRRRLPVLATGRWSLLRPAAREIDQDRWVEAATERLLQRYGVVLREICTRERSLPAWRLVLRQLRRLEARGVVRGGRFVSGFPGEQFALPEAVTALRATRRATDQNDVEIAAADPLNLTGIITSGARIPSSSKEAIVYRKGVPLAVGGEATASLAP